MFTKTGTYVGDGGTANAIAGVGFAPICVMIASTNTLSRGAVAIKVGSTTHTKTTGFSHTWDSQATITLDANGFTLTNSNGTTNATGVTYRYMAWGGAAADCAAFTYTGDGTDNRNVGALAFQPDFAIAFGSESAHTDWRTDQLGADLSNPMSTRAQANRIANFHAAGITVGTLWNTNTVVYYAFCVKKVATVFTTTEYNGNGADNRSIAHGLGATPAFTMIQVQNNAGSYDGVLVVRYASQVGDVSKPIGDSLAETDNFIQSVDGTNIQIGTNDYVNHGAGYTYTLATFAEVNAAAAGPGNSGNSPGRSRGNPAPGGGGNGGGGGSPISDPTRRAFRAMRRRTR